MKSCQTSRSQLPAQYTLHLTTAQSLPQEIYIKLRIFYKLFNNSQVPIYVGVILIMNDYKAGCQLLPMHAVEQVRVIGLGVPSPSD